MDARTEILFNLAGKPRREILNGREYLVAPFTSIRDDAVLDGSDGPILYPGIENAKSAPDWDGVDIVVYHPEGKSGLPKSARRIDVLSQQGVGRIFNSVHGDGALKGEGWFEVNALQKVDALLGTDLLGHLNRGEPIEVSTGLRLVKTPAPEGAVQNGKEYKFIASNYRPDHLAILPDQKGACSIDDGCGVFNSHDKKSLLRKFAEWLGVSNSNNEGSPMTDKAKLINQLIANCDCWTENDKDILNGFDDDKIKSLLELAQKTAKAEKVTNALTKFKHNGLTLVVNDSGDKIEVKEEKPDTVQGGSAPDKVQNNKPIPITEDNWRELLPPSVVATVENAQKIERAKKQELIDKIKTNSRNPYTDQQLEAMTLNMLEPLAKLAHEPDKEKPKSSFLANFAPLTNDHDKDELPLEDPVFDWEEMAKR